jgi:hypothetical protein
MAILDCSKVIPIMQINAYIMMILDSLLHIDELGEPLHESQKCIPQRLSNVLPYNIQIQLLGLVQGSLPSVAVGSKATMGPEWSENTYAPLPHLTSVVPTPIKHAGNAMLIPESEETVEFALEHTVNDVVERGNLRH